MGRTCVRLCCLSGGYDQFYVVTDRYDLKGLSLPAHSGREGVFTPTELLDGEDRPEWSIEGLDNSSLK